MNMRKLSLACLCLTQGVTGSVLASDFNIPFVNTAGLGVAYADWASATADASVAYTNPAALTEVPQQLMINPMGILGNAKFTGSAQTPAFPFLAPIRESGSASSSIHAFLPSFFYSRPISDRLSAGVGVTAPFGLGTNYGETSLVRYNATKSQVAGIDITPSVGFKVAKNVSLGVGFDAMHLAFELDSMYGPPFSFGDAALTNKLSGWGYGWHAGTLIHVLPKTKIGISYNSLISIQTNGTSQVVLPSRTTFVAYNQSTKAALPAHVQFSAQQDFTDKIAGMFTVFYTNWSTFNQIVMTNTMTPFGTTQPVTVPFNYHNTFDYALGGSYKVNETWLLRAGVQLMNTPSNDVDRGVADPIGGAVILTVGTHIKQSDALSYDLGIGHSFFKQQSVNLSYDITSLQGHTNTQTTVLGAQLNWKIG